MNNERGIRSKSNVTFRLNSISPSSQTHPTTHSLSSPPNTQPPPLTLTNEHILLLDSLSNEPLPLVLTKSDANILTCSTQIENRDDTKSETRNIRV